MNKIPIKSLRTLAKACILFAVFNYAFALIPDAVLWKLTLYNNVLPGQTRFPLESDLNLMFNSHEIAGRPAADNEYRVVALGDSSTWGYLLDSDETFASRINAAHLLTCRQRPVHVYNLGYPSLSVFKDLVILQQALAYKPDLIIWNVTLNSLRRRPEKTIKQNVIVKNNSGTARALIDRYGLATDLGKDTPTNTNTSLKNRTFLARRDQLDRYIHFQLGGIVFQAAGDQLDKSYVPLGSNVRPTDNFDDLLPPTLDPSILQFDVLDAGIKLAGTTPVLIINEPIQIVTGENSAVRYDKLYPRWAYDQYRQSIAAQAQQNGWNFTDLWNVLPPERFSNMPIHHTAQGDRMYSRVIGDLILKQACP